VVSRVISTRASSADATPAAPSAQQAEAGAPAPSTAAKKVPAADYQPPPPNESPVSDLAASPKPLPRTLPPVPGPAPSPPQPVAVPDTGPQPAATAQQDETAPADPSTSAEQEAPIGLAPFQQLHHLATEIDARSGELVDKYKVFLSRKEDGGSELTRSDQQLKDDLEAFQGAAETLDKQFQVGRWGRLFGHQADDLEKTRENVRRLATLGGQVDLLMNEVRPGPEVRKAWIEVRRRWKRVGLIVGGL
jgi:hypothetical protein